MKNPRCRKSRNRKKCAERERGDGIRERNWREKRDGYTITNEREETVIGEPMREQRRVLSENEYHGLNAGNDHAKPTEKFKFIYLLI
jgi:hypothetical protein